MGRLIRLLFLLALLGPLRFFASAAPAPCHASLDFRQNRPLSLVVRFETKDRRLEAQFRQALRFWQTILLLDWRETKGSDCNLLVRKDAQLAGRDLWGYSRTSGLIALLPSSGVPRRVLFEVSVHEIGHLLGLPHNPHRSSVMFFREDEDGPALTLDSEDCRMLAQAHLLRFPVR